MVHNPHIFSLWLVYMGKVVGEVDVGDQHRGYYYIN